MLKWIEKFKRTLFYRLFYLRKPPWDTNITPPELEELIASHPPGRALDLGCGTGTNVINLALHGWEAAGLDFVPAAIRKAKRKARQAGIKADFRVADVTDLDSFAGGYELILDIGCYHSLDRKMRSQYQRFVKANLSPEGTYMLYGFIGESDNRIGEVDIEAFQSQFCLKRREDSPDARGRSSAWFWFGQKAGSD